VQRPAAIDLYVRGVQAYQQGDRDQAVRDLLDATRANPELRMAHSLLGDLYRDEGNYQAATPHYETLIRIDPYGAENHYRLGVTYQFLARLQDAAASYLRALQLNPRDMRSNMNLGLVYLTLNQLDDAVTYLERATQLAPDSAVAWSNLGVALDARGSTVLAEAAYRRSLELSPRQDAIFINLGINLTRQGKAAEAISVLEQAIKHIDTPATRKFYGDALAAAKRYDDAIRQYDLSLKADPQHLPAMNEKGAALMQQYRQGMELDQTKRNQAIELWEKSLSLNPNQPQVRAALQESTRRRLFAQ
jgi:tetratricopeptide (TPR) repeat protein